MSDEFARPKMSTTHEEPHLRSSSFQIPDIKTGEPNIRKHQSTDRLPSFGKGLRSISSRLGLTPRSVDKVREKPNYDAYGIPNFYKLPPRMQKLLEDIPETADKVTGKSFRYLAWEDMESLKTSAHKAIRALEEYASVPRRQRLCDMLTIPTETRTAISRRQKAIRAALQEQRQQQEDEEEDAARFLAYKAASKQKTVISREESHDSGPLHNMIPDLSHRNDNTLEEQSLPDLTQFPSLYAGTPSFQSFMNGLGINWDNSAVTDQASTEHIESMGGTDTLNRRSMLSIPLDGTQPSTPSWATTSAAGSDLATSVHAGEQLSAEEEEEARESHRITATSFSSVDASGYASRTNPFGSFIKEPSAAELANLPRELRHFYKAHADIQDRLRAGWREQKSSTTAEDVARELWDYLVKLRGDRKIGAEVDGVEIFDMNGGPAMRALGAEEMRVLWAERFWERCWSMAW